METFIIVCLVMAIYLLIEDRIYRHRQDRRPDNDVAEQKHVDIMGKADSVLGQFKTVPAKQRQFNKPEARDPNFDLEIDQDEDVVVVSQERLERNAGNEIDLNAEEEEWNQYETSRANDGFTAGVTFEELNTVGLLLQQEELEANQKTRAVEIVQKIQGTELFSLLESSMEGAAQKIASLFESSFQPEMHLGLSHTSENEHGGFDIEEFV